MRYDVYDKLGFFKITVDFDLKIQELKKGFIEFLNNKLNKINCKELMDKVAVTDE